MKVVLKKGLETGLNTLVVLALKDKKSGKANFGKLPTDLAKWTKLAETDAQFSGDRKESILYRHAGVLGYTNVLLVGIGQAEAEALRTAGAMIFGALKNHKIYSAAIFGDTVLKVLKTPGAAMQALSEGMML